MALVRRTLEEIQEQAGRRRSRGERWSDERIRRAAASDPDSWLPSEDELKQFKPAGQRRHATVFSEDERKFDDRN